jgi:hypothetical protein
MHSLGEAYAADTVLEIDLQGSPSTERSVDVIESRTEWEI